MKILVYRIGQLGDALVSVPAVRAVKALYPHSQMDLLTDRKINPESVSVDKVFSGCGIFEKIFYYGPNRGFFGGLTGLAGTWLSMRRERYDALVYLAPSLRTDRQILRDRFFFRSMGIKHAWGFTLQTKLRTQEKPLQRIQAEALFLVERLTHDGLKISNQGLRFDLGITTEERAAVQLKREAAWPKDDIRVFAACPFTAMPAKKWPSSRYLDVFRRLYERHGLRPFFLGSEADSQEAQELVQALGVGYNLTGLSIRESASVMRRCDFYLGNDTGAMHLAASEGLPCVALFSARTHPGAWEPSGFGHQVLRVAVPCEGCELTHCVEHKMQCLDLIGADDVYAACQRVFSGLRQAD